MAGSKAAKELQEGVCALGLCGCRLLYLEGLHVSSRHAAGQLQTVTQSHGTACTVQPALSDCCLHVELCRRILVRLLLGQSEVVT